MRHAATADLACAQERRRVLCGKAGERMKHYIVQYIDGKYLARERLRPPLGEPVCWSGYATDSKTALQAARCWKSGEPFEE